MSYVYEPDEQPKRKHYWRKDEAGFEQVGPNFIGKCPRNLTLEDAQQLLDAGVPWSPPKWPKKHPKRLYAIHDGVVYRAGETVPGRSYHGYPEHKSRFPKGKEASATKEALLQRAEELGCELEVRRWMSW